MRVGRYINEVCQLLREASCGGIRVLADVCEENGVITGGVSLGFCSAPGSDGITSYFCVTRWFPSEEELDEFCELNINRFRIAARSPETVDAKEWR
jgi:hypothetical protein